MNNRFTSATALAAGLLTGSARGAIPTFSKDVAPILYKNCVSCHRAGEIAPMSLLTYQEARPWAKAIREYVSQGQMPPWHAVEPRGTFTNDRRLADSEKSTLVAWADAGAPEGNPKDLPPTPKFTEGWEIGKPDLVLSMQKPYDVPASGTIAYQYFQIPTNFTEDKWVQAFQVRFGNRMVVHHILVYVNDPNKSLPPDAFVPVMPKMPPMAGRGGNAQQQAGPGTLIAATAVGSNPTIFEPGSALRIPAGSTLLFQVHYTAKGQAATDQSSIGLIFAKGTPEKEIHTANFVNLLMKLPAGASDTGVDSAIEFTADSHVTAIIPHTHLRGKSWEYRLIYSDGTSKVVLTVPKYDFNWQTWYEFATPLAAPKGSRLEATAHYDNSVNNKFNPDPKVEVRWGDQTWNEMQYTAMTYYVDKVAPPATTAER
jgi:hypothetical protein